jgi:SAM-dependent methyltransferase
MWVSSGVQVAVRVARLISVENNPEWHTLVKAKLAATKVRANVEYLFIACDDNEFDEPLSHPYADMSNRVGDASLDFALVDGTIRATCMKAVLRKLKPGGLLILDNANRFIPNQESGWQKTIHEPRSEPRSGGWAGIIEQLRDWRWINTTDGIWDTRFWLKPLTLSNSATA